jgi:hypothetical protein
MLLEGHYELLEELEGELAADGGYGGWPLMRSRGEFVRVLRNGIAYPDLPCGRERVSRRTGRVTVSRFRLCGRLKVLQLLLLRRSAGVQLLSWLAAPRAAAAHASSSARLPVDAAELHELYQSHLGTQAHLHAMSPGLGDASVGEVTYRIVRQLLLLAFRAADAARRGDRTYPHWLGMMLHVLTDSYTPGHVVRRHDAPLVRPPDVRARAHAHAGARARAGAEEPGAEEPDATLALDAALYRLAKRTRERPLTLRQLRAALPSLGALGAPPASAALVASALVASAGRSLSPRPAPGRGRPGTRAQRTVHRAYLRYVMHHQTSADVRALLPDVRGAYEAAQAAAAARARGGRPAARRYDVVNYSHYDSQPPGFHLLNDRLELIRERPAMYARMLRECAALLGLFRAHLTAHPPRSSGGGEDDGAAARRALMLGVLALLAGGPFRLRPSRAAAPAGARYRA